MKKKPAVLKILVKCDDQFIARLKDSEGMCLGLYQGYVPDFMPPDSDGFHDPDYVELHIDIATGKIRNWKKPSAKALKSTFGL